MNSNQTESRMYQIISDFKTCIRFRSDCFRHWLRMCIRIIQWLIINVVPCCIRSELTWMWIQNESDTNCLFWTCMNFRWIRDVSDNECGSRLNSDTNCSVSDNKCGSRMNQTLIVSEIADNWWFPEMCKISHFWTFMNFQ